MADIIIDIDTLEGMVKDRTLLVLGTMRAERMEIAAEYQSNAYTVKGIWPFRKREQRFSTVEKAYEYLDGADWDHPLCAAHRFSLVSNHYRTVLMLLNELTSMMDVMRQQGRRVARISSREIFILTQELNKQ